MKKLLFIIIAALSLSLAAFAQTNTTTQNNDSTNQEVKKRPPIFRATKDQIMQVQKMLKVEETGKMDDGFRGEIKKYQTANGLKATGTLNRATLEKMNVVLTDKQKEIPVSPNSFATGDDSKKSTTPRKPIFRANKEQITEVQKMLKDKKLYDGEATGKLDDPTREAIKKFQSVNNVKVTGTLNKETLLKMGITLTDKQKEM